jgi:two-component system nitrogen regulation response regulator GlnG
MDLTPGSLTDVARRLRETAPVLVEHLRGDPGKSRVYRDALALLERALLAHALALTGGNQLRAARLLGLNRNTVRKRCRELGLAPASAPDPAGGRG